MSASQRLPAGVAPVYAFQCLNALSWTVVQGVPLMLFLKSQGAPATVLGMATALVPLMQVLQLWGASRVARLGPRRVVIEGWSGRTVVIAVIAGIALAAPWLGPLATLVATMLALAAYTVLRGLATAGFLPWWQRLVPEAVRGRFLATEALVMHGTVMLSLLLCSLFLAHWQGTTAYAVLFAWAFATALGGLWALRRIPDVPAEPEAANPTSIPWRELLRHRPFRLLLTFSVLFNTAAAGAATCWVPLMRDRFAASDAIISLLPAASSLATVLALPLVARILDRVGSRPVMFTGVGILVGHLLLWGALAAGAIPYGIPSLAIIELTAGTSFALVNIASTRLLMQVVPGQGRTHFFAMHGVIAFGVILGTLPTCWGLAIDLLHSLDRPIAGLSLNAWSLIYPLLALIALASLLALTRVPEPRALTTRDFLAELFVRTPGRALARLLRLE
jgi:MFS family permease